jgi:2-hydroxy-3-keto-5-methylthiopentenyl-1-phosphate phosphatase
MGMYSLFDKLYNAIRKNEIRCGKIMLRKINIDAVFNALTKECWRNDIQYKTILKDGNSLIIKLIGRKQIVLFRFHKTDMVFDEDYEKFVGLINIYSASKGVYICTGVFEGKVEKNFVSNFHFLNGIKIEDGFHFVKRNLGLRQKAAEIFKNNKFNFLVYLPI